LKTVNAQYVLDKNSIVIPAAVLQPPFFSSGIPDYINYGGIGSLIGHELTHAFDNTGKDFDMNGNLSNWVYIHIFYIINNITLLYK